MNMTERKLLEQNSKDLAEIKDLLQQLSIDLKHVYSIINCNYNEIEEKHLHLEVSNILKKLGFSCSHKGYNYTCTAIIACIKNPNLLPATTKSLYPMLARNFSTTPTAIERAIHLSIVNSWPNADANFSLKIFGYDSSKKKCPTNKQFISSIVYMLKQNN